jgi:hypothetical protein
MATAPEQGSIGNEVRSMKDRVFLLVNERYDDDIRGPAERYSGFVGSSHACSELILTRPSFLSEFASADAVANKVTVTLTRLFNSTEIFKASAK